MTVEIPDYQQPDAASLAFADSFAPEDEAMTNARLQGIALGCAPISPGSGAMLRFAASCLNAKHVVEVGTGAGVASLWMLRGMPSDGVLTSIDLEVDHQRAARTALDAADIAPGQYRLIAGRALEVLPRLTDEAYDLILVDSDTAEYGLYLEQALRLLRPGGVIAFNGVFLSGNIADASKRDDTTAALRELLQHIRDSKRLAPVLVPSGSGLLLTSVI
jgi:predicted O-methyltransferase YrrM